MKKLAIFMVTAGLACATMTAQASNHDQAGLKIGVLDLPSVLKQSPKMQAVGDKLKAKFKPRQDAIMQQAKQLKTEQAKLKKDEAVMSKSDLAGLQDKIVKDQRKLRQMQEDFVQDAKMAQSQAMQKILTKVDDAVKQIATAGHYDLIMQKDSVAYASARVDITPQVVKELKKLN